MEKKTINFKDLSDNSLENLEYFVRFIPANSPLRKSMIIEILKKKNKSKEEPKKEPTENKKPDKEPSKINKDENTEYKK